MIQSVMMANNFSFNSVLDIIHLVNVLGNVHIPKSLHLFKKVSTEEMTFDKHYFCKICEKQFGIEEPKNLVCINCKESSIDFFVHSPMKDKLSEIIDKNYESIVKYEDEIKSVGDEYITDINNADWYKQHADNGIISLNINTDGVQPFNASTKSSLWPLLASINNLPPKERFKKRNILATTFWLSDNQPNMKIFLAPFMVDIQELYTNGIVVRGKHFKILVAACCTDSPARSKVLEMKQFNGSHGCTYCYHPTVQQHYPVMTVEKRNFEQHLQHIADYERLPPTRKKDVMGVQGRTELLKIPFFDPTKQMPVDFMHCVILGVVRHIFTLWFTTKYHEQPFYIDINNRRVIDQRYKELKTYSERNRKSDNITKMFSKMKANELFNVFLYDSKFILSCATVKPVYIQHFNILLNTIEILCSQKIRRSQIDLCEQNLDVFVQQFQELYGVTFMVFNVHLLKHLSDTVRMFGPLFTTSLFIFESINGVISRFISGPKGPVLQICTKYFMYFSNYYCLGEELSVVASRFCKSVTNKANIKYKYTNEHKKSTVYLLPRHIENPYNEIHEFSSFERYYYKDTLLRTVENSDKNARYNDSFIYHKEKFYKIQKILVNMESCPETLFVVAQQMYVNHFPALQNYYEIAEYGQNELIRIDSHFQKCFAFEIYGNDCLVIIKNMLLVD
jgi:hypothetical protein